MEPINFYSENYQNNATLYKMLNDYKYSLEKDFTVKTKTSFKEHFLFIKNSKMKPREKKKTEINVQSVRQGSSEKKKLPDKSQYTIISRINKTKQKNGKVHQQLGRNSVDYEGWNTL